MKKIKLLSIVLTAFIMLLGVGYAYWTDAVTFSNTVNTGQVELHFDTQNAGNFSIGPTYLGQPVATGLVGYTEDKKAATVTIDNLFPGAAGSIALTIKNNSTIPVKFGSFAITAPTYTNGLNKDDIKINANVYYGNDLKATFLDVLSMTSTPTIADVVPAGVDVRVELTYSMPSSVVASEAGSVNFSVTPTFIQFNQ